MKIAVQYSIVYNSIAEVRTMFKLSTDLYDRFYFSTETSSTVRYIRNLIRRAAYGQSDIPGMSPRVLYYLRMVRIILNCRLKY